MIGREYEGIMSNYKDNFGLLKGNYALHIEGNLFEDQGDCYLNHSSDQESKNRAPDLRADEKKSARG